MDVHSISNMVEILKIKLNEILSIKYNKISVEKKDIVRCLRIVLAIGSIMSPTYGTYLLYSQEEEYFKIKIVESYLKYCKVFFSVWSLIFSTICLNIFALIDVVDICMKRSPKTKMIKEKLHEIGSFLLFSVSIPISLTVALIFWSLYFFDSETIYPRALLPILPATLNHLYHSCPPLVGFFLLVTTNQRRPSKDVTRASLLTYIISYGIMLLGIKAINGDWVYIAFDIFSPIQMAAFLAFALSISLVFHSVAYLIYDLVRG